MFFFLEKRREKIQLQVQSARRTKPNEKNENKGKRASQWISLKASVTVEASLAFPIFLFFLYAILMVGQMLITDAEVHRALTQTARHLGKYSYAVMEEETNDESKKNSVLSLGYAKMKLSGYLDKSRIRFIKGSTLGVSLKNSKILNEDDQVELVADYKYRLSIPFLGSYDFPLRQQAIVRAWNGYEKEDGFSSEEYVYVAETGSVYHTDLNCSYIAIKVVPAEDVLSYQGKSQCHLCRKSINTGKYVTISGSCVHKDSNCSALKRTIHLVRKDKLGSLPRCSRCSRNED